ncbi:glycosyltransferase family protein [Sphingomicrobium clamense]|uniref:Spore protein YkvP/CgeB glycosyl transferase-like domain-containing protein n=1 Tax=Sphingomicrobium clamense TaxID=2851013 RepID=A0ABS6V6U2_9SPHN|nr:hypothetical protein [Sphingomicrobium sp. B8]MBW0145289.1 hypothetical protein [Sphingomicrobium sp. B8]
MRIAIVRSPKAYLPEADAYKRYLTGRGFEARCVESRDELQADETAILFRFEDQFARNLRARRRIHEEHNLPIGWRAKARAVAMKFAPEPHGLIRLEQVADQAPTGPQPTLVRLCGIDEAIFDTNRVSHPEFDLVYCGSLERPGMATMLERLGRRGFTIAVYGRVPPGWPTARLAAAGVKLFGKIARDDVPKALSNARAGLNYTPDHGPLPFQESIKTLEYVAAGLPVVANCYPWAERFAKEHATQFLWIDEKIGPADLDRLAPPDVDLTDRTWPALFDRIGLIDFLTEVSK